VYLLAGLVTATVAVLVVHKRMSQTPAASAEVERVKVLVARRDIGYGEELVLSGEDANVGFAPFLKEFVPNGAITNADDIAGRKLRARGDIAQHEAILQRRMADDSDFVPDGMCTERVAVDSEDVKSGRYRPGMKVDVLRIVGSRAIEFMRCVRVYAVGRLDLFGHPVKGDDVPPNVFLLIKKADEIPFIEAQLSGRFRLVEASRQGEGGPVLVEQQMSPEMRKRAAKEIIDRARKMDKAGQQDKALVELEQVLKEYGDLSEVYTEATVLAEQCRERAATDLYDSARQAFETDKQYTLAMQLLDRIDRDYPSVETVVHKAALLRPAIEAALKESQRQQRYEDLLAEIDAALDIGDLPLVGQKLEELESFGDFKSDGSHPDGAAAIRKWGKAFRDAQSRYDLSKKVLESYLKQGKHVDAREKLKQIKETFPAHPELKQLEEAVNKAAGLNE